MGSPLFCEPRNVTDLRHCNFYHTVDIPGHGTVEGAWDLREGAKAYLGQVDFKNKRVLEVGAADGFLGFFMEKEGADVIGYDLSENHAWDIVPFAQYDYEAILEGKRERIRMLNNAWWFLHRVFQSKARLAFGDVYHIPAELGPVDICTFGSILLH